MNKVERYSYLISRHDLGSAVVAGYSISYPILVPNVIVVARLYAQDDKGMKRKILTSFLIWPN